MKKQLFFAALFAGATLLVGCQPNTPTDPDKDKPGSDTPKTTTTLTVSPKELTLELGESYTLSAKLNPAVAGATIEWKSSNANIVSVTKRGIIEALDYGEVYIYASYDDLKDSCLVKVQKAMESLLFTGAIVWDEDSTYYADPETGVNEAREIEASDGSKFYVIPVQATLYVFSDGFYVNNSGDFDGTEEGVILEINAPMWMAPKDRNNSDYNTVFCLGEWDVVSPAELMRQSEPGSIDEVTYVGNMKSFVDAYMASDAQYATYLKAAIAAFSTPHLTGIYYDTDDKGEGGYYYDNASIPVAICKEAHMSLNNDFASSQWMCGMDYCHVIYEQLEQDTVFGLYSGLNLGWNLVDTTIVFNDEKVHKVEITSAYGELPAESEAPMYKPIRVPVIKKDMPQIATRIEQQLQDKKVIKLRKKF